jgi:hypothetical protein
MNQNDTLHETFTARSVVETNLVAGRRFTLNCHSRHSKLPVKTYLAKLALVQ